MRRTYQRDGWQVEVVEHANGGGIQVHLRSSRGRLAHYYHLWPSAGEITWDECPYPTYESEALRESGHVRELTAWAVAQWCEAERILEPDLTY